MAPSLPSHQGSSCKHTRLCFTNAARLPRACPTLAAARRAQQTCSSASAGDPGYTAAGDPQQVQSDMATLAVLRIGLRLLHTDPATPMCHLQGPDLVSSVLNSCLAATAHLTDQVVTRLADALQTVAPPDAPRSKVRPASVRPQPGRQLLVCQHRLHVQCGHISSGGWHPVFLLLHQPMR